MGMWILPTFMLAPPLRYGVGCTLLDSFIHCPLLYTPSFYISTNLFSGHSLQYSIDELRLRYVESQLACLGFWLPVTAMNFSLLPLRFITLAMQTENFCWSIILDYIANKEI